MHSVVVLLLRKTFFLEVCIGRNSCLALAQEETKANTLNATAAHLSLPPSLPPSLHLHTHTNRHSQDEDVKNGHNCSRRHGRSAWRFGGIMGDLGSKTKRVAM